MLTIKLTDALQAKLGIRNVHEVVALLERGVSPSTFRHEQTLAAELEATKLRLANCESRLHLTEAKLQEAHERAKPKKLLWSAPLKLLHPVTPYR